MAMTTCRECRGAVSRSAMRCPHCAAIRPAWSPAAVAVGYMIRVISLLFLLLFFLLLLFRIF